MCHERGPGRAVGSALYSPCSSYDAPQVPYCQADLRALGESAYFRHRRICTVHAKAEAVDVLGEIMRLVWHRVLHRCCQHTAVRVRLGAAPRLLVHVVLLALAMVPAHTYVYTSSAKKLYSRQPVDAVPGCMTHVCTRAHVPAAFASSAVCYTRWRILKLATRAVA